MGTLSACTEIGASFGGRLILQLSNKFMSGSVWFYIQLEYLFPLATSAQQHKVCKYKGVLEFLLCDVFYGPGGTGGIV